MTSFSNNSSLPNRSDGIPAPKLDAVNGWVLGTNPAVRKIARHVERASEVQCTVLISGETGTGKELWARSIHRCGPRAARPFIPVNCAALTISLAESQLFGHQKGAFTGAAGSALGVFRAAQGGIVFLDEVGEMPLELQPKLLRVLQQREVTPVGAAVPVPIDIQVIAATNRNLDQEVSEGRFREDLFYRLNMVDLRVPPLRERLEDLPELIEFFSKRFSQRYDRPLWRPSTEDLHRFGQYRWPGNIRQLSHVIEQSYVLDTIPDVPVNNGVASRPSHLPSLNLSKLRSEAVNQALKATRGHKGRAARLLGIHANTLTRLLTHLQAEASDSTS
jgi:DNA-binding NtrC family response regulator